MKTLTRAQHLNLTRLARATILGPASYSNDDVQKLFGGMMPEYVLSLRTKGSAYWRDLTVTDAGRAYLQAHAVPPAAAISDPQALFIRHLLNRGENWVQTRDYATNDIPGTPVTWRKCVELGLVDIVSPGIAAPRMNYWKVTDEGRVSFLAHPYGKEWVLERDYEAWVAQMDAQFAELSVLTNLAPTDVLANKAVWVRQQGNVRYADLLDREVLKLRGTERISALLQGVSTTMTIEVGWSGRLSQILLPLGVKISCRQKDDVRTWFVNYGSLERQDYWSDAEFANIQATNLFLALRAALEVVDRLNQSEE